MRQLLIFITTMFICSGAIASESDSTEYNTAIIIDNGGKIIGKIVEDIADKKHIKLETKDGKVIKIPRRRIVRMTTADKVDSVQQMMRDSLGVAPPVPTTFKSLFTLKGRFSSRSGESLLGGSIMHGWLINGNSMIGVGAGYNWTKEYRLIPVFAEGRIFISESGSPNYLVINFEYLIGKNIGPYGWNSFGIRLGTYIGFTHTWYKNLTALLEIGGTYSLLNDQSYNNFSELGFAVRLGIMTGL